MRRLNESRMGALITEAFGVRLATQLRSSLNAQHGTALLVGLDSDVTVTTPGRPLVRARAVVLAPDQLHVGVCEGPTLALLYDPELSPGLACYARRDPPAFPLDASWTRRLGEALISHRARLPQPDVLAGLAEETAVLIQPQHRAPSIDRRIARALETLRGAVDARDLGSDTGGLSPAHFRELFVRDVGIPPRTYRLWRRLLFAVASFSRHDATTAAHDAGFADLAHFSRTCRRMLGDSPTRLGRDLLEI